MSLFFTISSHITPIRDATMPFAPLRRHAYVYHAAQNMHTALLRLFTICLFNTRHVCLILFYATFIYETPRHVIICLTPLYINCCYAIITLTLRDYYHIVWMPTLYLRHLRHLYDNIILRASTERWLRLRFTPRHDERRYDDTPLCRWAMTPRDAISHDESVWCQMMPRANIYTMPRCMMASIFDALLRHHVIGLPRSHIFTSYATFYTYVWTRLSTFTPRWIRYINTPITFTFHHVHVSLSIFHLWHRENTTFVVDCHLLFTPRRHVLTPRHVLLETFAMMSEDDDYAMLMRWCERLLRLRDADDATFVILLRRDSALPRCH